MILVERHIVLDRNISKEIDKLMLMSKNIYNLALYYIRQHYFKTNKWLSYVVLIDGMVLVNHNIEERSTTDIDFMFLTSNDIPTEIYGFKKTRKSAFQHNKTHVEIEVLTPSFLGLSQEFVELIFNTAYDKGKFKIASPSAIVALKLNRFSNTDIIDIKNLIKNYKIDITDFIKYLSEDEIEKYNTIFL